MSAFGFPYFRPCFGPSPPNLLSGFSWPYVYGCSPSVGRVAEDRWPCFSEVVATSNTTTTTNTTLSTITTQARKGPLGPFMVLQGIERTCRFQNGTPRLVQWLQKPHFALSPDVWPAKCSVCVSGVCIISHRHHHHHPHPPRPHIGPPQAVRPK